MLDALDVDILRRLSLASCLWTLSAVLTFVSDWVDGGGGATSEERGRRKEGRRVD